MGRLSTTKISSLMKMPGRHGDGDGLYLVVTQSLTASWVLRIQKDGRRRDFGLGGGSKVSLATARTRARKIVQELEDGLDPVLERRKRVETPNFEQAAIAFHREQKSAWRNGKHKEQWISTLRKYAFPRIGNLPVDRVDASHVRDLLAEIWLAKNETARRVRQRVAAVIEWAVGKGYRESSLPLNVINRALPKANAKPTHHAALPYADLHELFCQIGDGDTIGKLALKATILTAARSGEIRFSTWEEIDFDAQLWNVPAHRMKSQRPHVVPLSKEAIGVFREAKKMSKGALCFEGAQPGRPLSDMTMTKVLRTLGIDCTVHGFRSSFRDWVAEATSFAGELAEAQLAHQIPNKTEAAYRRGDLLEKRRGMMDAWGRYCTQPVSNKLRLIAG